MNNQELIQKMKKDMELRNFSKYTYDSYLGKTRYIMRYFGEKNLEDVSTEELRIFLLEYLKDERKLEDSSINYYNSVIRFVYEVTLDKALNERQLPMRKKKKKLYKVLTKKKLSTFFNAVDDFKFKTIFMLIYGSGLRIGEIEKLQIQDIDSKNMRIFVREGKGNKERYTILPEKSLEMLREYWAKYRPKGIKSDAMFFDANNKPINVYVIRTHFRKYRRKAEVLNIKYYHIVFTIPSELYLIALQNQEKIYKILFKTSAETLQELSEDKKYLGGEIGFFSILHTWG